MSVEIFGDDPEEGSEGSGAEATESPVEQSAAPDEGHAIQEPAEATQPDPEPQEPEQQASAEDDDEALPEGSEGVRIGRRIYSDVASADRSFLKLRGRLSETDKRANQLAAENARLLGIMENIAKQAPSQPPPPEVKPPEPPAKPQRLKDLIDPDEIETLIQEQGPGAFAQRLMDLIEDRVIPERIAQIVEERTAPANELAQEKRWVDAQEKFFSAAFEAVDEGGNRLYPELDIDSDPETAMAVHRIWHRNASDPDLSKLALTKKALDIAVFEYRATRPAAPPQPAPQPSTPRPVLQARAAARTLVGGMNSSGSARPGFGAAPGNGEAKEAWQQRQATDHEVFGTAN